MDSILFIINYNAILENMFDCWNLIFRTYWVQSYIVLFDEANKCCYSFVK